MARRHSRHPSGREEQPRPGQAPPVVEAPSAEGHPHRHGNIPLVLILVLIVAVEITVIATNFGKWQYRTVIRDAKAAMAEGRWEDALKYWADHAENYPGAVATVSYRTDRAKSRLGAKDYQGALEDLNYILGLLDKKSKSPDADLLSDLAKCEAALGRKERARETYEKVLKLDPSNADAHLYIGRRFLEKREILQAAKHFQAVPVERYPEDLKAEWHVIEDEFVKRADKAAQDDTTTGTTKGTEAESKTATEGEKKPAGSGLPSPAAESPEGAGAGKTGAEKPATP